MEIVKSITNQKIIKKISLIVIGSIILTLSAKLKIPFYPVPMTMQTFMVLCIGIPLGPIIGLLTVSLYLVLGIVLPICPVPYLQTASLQSADNLPAFVKKSKLD